MRRTMCIMFVLVISVFALSAGTATAGNVNNPGDPINFGWLEDNGSLYEGNLITVVNGNKTLMIISGAKLISGPGSNRKFTAGACDFNFNGDTAHMRCSF